MEHQELFAAFLQETQIKATKYEAFSFGTDADELAELVRSGKKTACSSACAMYEHENTPLPQVGQYSVILDSRGNAICVIRTTLVYVCAFDKVPPLHAAKEGEADGSLAYWRAVHKDFFSRELQSIGLSFDRKISVVCEEFELVYPKKGESE